MSKAPRACVIGWPVEHSRSPAIHGYWLRQYGIDGAYEKEAVPPEDFAAFVSDLSAHGYVGANVTLPHKEAALRAAASADAAAEAIGAANTLWLDANGALQASNTDAYGFMTNLYAGAPRWRETCDVAMVLGAGGAARAVLYGLIEAGVSRILLTNRTVAKAETLAREFGAPVEVLPWESKESALSACGLLVNTTSLGMTGQPPLDIMVEALPQSAVVTDIVYVPLETALLAAARRRGLAAIDGLGMLLHQAVPGFERWFGLRPEVTPDLRAHVVATLGGG
ncbi:shikimate dehydrogenase [Methyloceanibacter methanicus]|uniref:Shikimate dehydrogenase (NADP(+)) n=1 Tax=Methyloceanibacter methanicus TaxID=1774968 RepID=A0A1E3W5T6_9HYPH|nr:shikimate dehydrogenase [Methyloceanibacter methanicus]ODS01173.1 shikimate dehydrogenase [Methyloceanibacter methanicus]